MGLVIVFVMSAANADDDGCSTHTGSGQDLGQEVGVLITGAVERPGRYDEAGSQSTAQMLAQAGGLKRSAYPLGVMVLRPNIVNEQSRVALPVIEPSNIALDAMQVFMGLSDPCTRQVVERVVNEAGWQRVAIDIDPVAQRGSRTTSSTLVDGDIVIVPQRTSGVMVVGHVLHPGVVQFQSTADARSYIDDAGGTASGARLGDAFVYLPHGVRRPLSASVWDYQRQNVPPGSVIVVPGTTDSSSRLWHQLTRFLD